MTVFRWEIHLASNCNITFLTSGLLYGCGLYTYIHTHMGMTLLSIRIRILEDMSRIRHKNLEAPMVQSHIRHSHTGEEICFCGSTRQYTKLQPISLAQIEEAVFPFLLHWPESDSHWIQFCRDVVQIAGFSKQSLSSCASSDKVCSLRVDKEEKVRKLPPMWLNYRIFCRPAGHFWQLFRNQWLIAPSDLIVSNWCFFGGGGV